MTTFALAHGAAHDGWSWGLLAAELEALGHRSIAPDLPIDDLTAGARACADVLADALPDDGDDVVVVGHSLGGTIVPVAATMLQRVVHMVFLASVVPTPGARWAELGEPALTMPPESRTVDAEGRSVVHPEWARRLFFHDCPADVAEAGVARLRPTSPVLSTEPCPIERWPAVPASYVVCRGDRCLSPAWGRDIAQRRLGHPALELDGGHDPQLSRPTDLARLLDGLALS